MIYIPLRHLKPGMMIARDITRGSTVFPLVTAGQKLTAALIEKLAKNQIAGVYIESTFCDDIEIHELIEPEFKQKIVSELKNFYKTYTTHSAISVTSLKSMSGTVDGLVTQILSKGECLVNIVDIKDYDTYTYTHSMYVCIFSILIGIQLGYPRSALTELAMCGLLHDIGKLDIPLEIINKKSALTSEEFEVIKTHPDKAAARLKHCHQISSSVMRGILSHHEKYDGTGYPKGLAGKKIPIYGRILALADVYDALTSQRSYRKAWSSSEAVEYMMGCADTHFDMNLLQSFLKTVAAYPVGTVVRLSNGFLAVVIQNSSQNILRPKVRIVLPEQYKGTEIDLATPDEEYLHVIISGEVDDAAELPDGLFH